MLARRDRLARGLCVASALALAPTAPRAAQPAAPTATWSDPSRSTAPPLFAAQATPSAARSDPSRSTAPPLFAAQAAWSAARSDPSRYTAPPLFAAQAAPSAASTTPVPAAPSAASTTPVPAPPSPGRVQLRWRAPADRCPGAAELVARIDGLLGETTTGLEADATVQPPRPGELAGWRLDLELRWPHGHDDRTLHARSCADLADATVVLVAVIAAPLTMSPRLAAPPQPLPPAPTIAPAIGPSIEPAEPIEPPLAADELDTAAPAPAPAPPPIVRPPRRRGPFARVAGIAGYGVLPRADLGIALAFGGLRPRLRIEGALVYLPAQSTTLGDGRGVTHGFAAAGARVCPRFLGSPVELSLCGGLEAGASWGRSLGLSPDRRAAGPWFALSLGAALDWWFSPQVALHVGVDGLGAPVATSFSIGDETLAGGRHFALRGLLGLGFALAQQKAARPEK